MGDTPSRFTLRHSTLQGFLNRTRAEAAVLEDAIYAASQQSKNARTPPETPSGTPLSAPSVPSGPAMEALRDQKGRNFIKFCDHRGTLNLAPACGNWSRTIKYRTRKDEKGSALLKNHQNKTCSETVYGVRLDGA